jgi:uncharacterized RDD family membrane protein YckC
MAKEWYWLQGGVSNGPAEIDDLADLYHRSEIPSSTLIWRTTEEEGLPLGEALSGLGKLPPPLPGTDIAPQAARVPLPAFLIQESPFPPQVLDPHGWTDTTPHPWRRYFARMMDTTLNGGLVFFVIGVGWAYFDAVKYDRFLSTIGTNPLADAFLTVLFAIPPNALLMGLTGSSMGKWFFGIRVVGQDAHPIGFVAALSREFDVWLRGLGLGIPLFSLFTMFRGYQTLTNSGSATWDTDRWSKDRARKAIVLHRPDGTKATILIVAGFVVWVLLRTVIQLLSL